MKTNNVLRILILTGLSFVFSSCENIFNKLQTNTPVFSIDRFEENLIDYVNWGNTTPTAWAYTISHNGVLKKSAAFGDARNAADGQLNFTVNKEINVASVSKFYTTIAAMQLLEANNLTVDDKILTYLPDSWNPGPGVDDLTFKDLLMHRSGLESENTNFDETLVYSGLKECIETGVINSKNRSYLNVNFALFRVLIPSLWSQLDNAPAIDIESDGNTQFTYLLYLQQYVFDPLDLALVGCIPEARDICTLYYDINDDETVMGAYYGDWNPWCGGGGYFMSVMEMAKVNAYFEHTEVLVSEEARNTIKQFRLGLDNGFSDFEEHGKYYGKNGSISNGSGQGVLTQIEMFPLNGIDCVVVMNSQGVTFKDNETLKKAIYLAYNDAWE